MPASRDRREGKYVSVCIGVGECRSLSVCLRGQCRWEE